MGKRPSTYIQENLSCFNKSRLKIAVINAFSFKEYSQYTFNTSRAIVYLYKEEIAQSQVATCTLEL